MAQEQGQALVRFCRRATGCFGAPDNSGGVSRSRSSARRIKAERDILSLPDKPSTARTSDGSTVVATKTRVLPSVVIRIHFLGRLGCDTKILGGTLLLALKALTLFQELDVV